MTITMLAQVLCRGFVCNYNACNVPRFSCNNCRLSNVTENIRQLLHKNCSALHAINCTWNHGISYGFACLCASHTRRYCIKTTARRFFAYWFLWTLVALRYWKIRVSPKIRVFPLGILSQNVDLENLAMTRPPSPSVMLTRVSGRSVVLIIG